MEIWKEIEKEERGAASRARAPHKHLTWMFVPELADPLRWQEGPTSTSGACAHFLLPENTRISCYIIGIPFSSQMRAGLH